MRPANNCYYIDATDPKFSSLEGNREIINGHVADIAKAMLKNERHIPGILVGIYNGKKYVVDGQHRYVAAQFLWENGIDYELLVDEYETNNPYLDAVIMNNTQISWSLRTYLRAFAIAKYPYYSDFLEWVEGRNWRRAIIPYRIALAFFGVVNLAKLRKGELKMSNTFENATKQFDMLYGTTAFDVVFFNEPSTKAFYRIFRNESLDSLKIFVETFEGLSLSDITLPSSIRISDWEMFYRDWINTHI